MNTVITTGNTQKSTLSIMLLLVCFYIFLVIERPWESIRYLEGIPVERPFAILMILAALATGKLRIVNSPTNKWVFSLLALHFILAPFAFNTGFAVDQGVEYAKMVVLYILMMAVAGDERALKTLVAVYVGSTFFYMLHSLWEYNNGRHVYRMGIARMIGVDSTFNDPNSFGASLVLSLPFLYALLKTENSTKLKIFCYLHIALVFFCVALTGSRSATVALLTLIVLWALLQKGFRKFGIFAITIAACSLIWVNLPEDKQERIRSIWDKEAGPANAHASADGRIEGFLAGWEMYKRYPLTGVGGGGRNFGGYRSQYLDGRTEQAHNLAGQVLGAFGSGGAILLCGLIFSISRSSIISIKRTSNDSNLLFLNALSCAILTCLFLLLLFGLAGHNFYRPLWLWLAAWTGTILFLLKNRKDLQQ